MRLWLVFACACASSPAPLPTRSDPGHVPSLVSARLTTGHAHWFDIVVDGWLADLRCRVVVDELARDSDPKRLVRPCAAVALPPPEPSAVQLITTKHRRLFDVPNAYSKVHEIIALDSFETCEQLRAAFIAKERTEFEEKERVRAERVAMVKSVCKDSPPEQCKDLGRRVGISLDARTFTPTERVCRSGK